MIVRHSPMLLGLLGLGSFATAGPGTPPLLAAYSGVRCNGSSIGTPAYANDNVVFTVCAERLIYAPIDNVYDTLLDFSRYHEWNTFVVEITNRDGSPVAPGLAKLGQQVTFTSAGLLPLINATSNEIVSVADRSVVPAPQNPAGKVAINAWTAEGMTGLQAQHPNVLTDLGNGNTRYVSYESYYGPLALLLKTTLKSKLQRQFSKQADDLKQFVEARTGR